MICEGRAGRYSGDVLHDCEIHAHEPIAKQIHMTELCVSPIFTHAVSRLSDVGFHAAAHHISLSC